MKQEHKYAQALRWIAEGKDVQARMQEAEYANFPGDFSMASIESVLLGEPGWEFRLAPRTIFVNGVEVPAPESVAPRHGSEYYLPNFGYSDCLHEDLTWTGNEFDLESLKRGLVYLNKEDAIARAKAMLLTQE